MKILFPVDGSDCTERMLRYVVEQHELPGTGNEYVAFTAVAEIPGHVADHLDRDTLDRCYQDQADQVLLPVKALADRMGWKFRLAHAAGRAAEAIAAFAETEKPGLIVMGAQGHSALGNVVLGSVASGVLARCKTPVLLFR